MPICALSRSFSFSLKVFPLHRTDLIFSLQAFSSDLFIEGVILCHFILPKITRHHLFFYQNKLFSHRSSFFLRDFVIRMRCCVIRRLVRRCLILLLVVVFDWFLLKYRFQSIIYSTNDLGVTLQILIHGYFSHFYFIILFVNILSLYVINLSVVSLFADSSIMLSDMLSMWLYFNHFINSNEYHFFVRKKKLVSLRYKLLYSPRTKLYLN